METSPPPSGIPDGGIAEKAQYVDFVNVMTQNVVKMFLHSQGHML